VGGQRVSVRLRVTRGWWRPALGVLMAAAAFAIVFNLDQTLQTHLGSYTTALQRHTEETGYATHHLDSLRGVAHKPTVVKNASSKLPDYGPAPGFPGIAHWLNTAKDTPLTIQQLRGKVVLVDFWTYSCINCLRTIPHLQGWYAAYHRDGFDIVGVHTPEFAFEHDLSNVEGAVHRLGVTWPVALDNGYDTWNAYSNEYWPADYLVDKSGNVRTMSFGEGDYASTEDAIRSLLGVSGPATTIANRTPTELQTPETYLGPSRFDPSRYVGRKPVLGKQVTYTLAQQIPQNDISYGGLWTLSGQIAEAGLGATLGLHFHAKDVYVVLGGRGHVGVTVDGRTRPSIDVTADKLYTLFTSPTTTDAQLRLSLSPGVHAYSFTFG
jgi:thiol-disulfide isomerase/thioredoxin